MASFNARTLRREILRQAKRPIEARAQEVVQRKLVTETKRTLAEFEAHPVTKEIEAGPYASSRYLKNGNLYSFIGFEDGYNPTEEVAEYIENNIRLRGRPKIIDKGGDKVIVSQIVELPSLRGIYAETEQTQELGNWTSKSWLQLLEQGIPWFRSYLYFGREKKDSRSGPALQAKNKEGGDKIIRGGSFPPIKYLSEIFAKLRVRISK